MRTTDEMWSTPLLNILRGVTLHQYIEEYTVLMERHPQPAVAWHKQTLGRQDYTFVGERRYWVWERETAGIRWRVYVSNIRGISLEVEQGATPDQALGCWRDYRSQMIMAQFIETLRSGEFAHAPRTTEHYRYGDTFCPLGLLLHLWGQGTWKKPAHTVGYHYDAGRYIPDLLTELGVSPEIQRKLRVWHSDGVRFDQMAVLLEEIRAR